MKKKYSALHTQELNKELPLITDTQTKTEVQRISHITVIHAFLLTQEMLTGLPLYCGLPSKY